jgi:mono/diheme cytochrome c family protein
VRQNVLGAPLIPRPAAGLLALSALLAAMPARAEIPASEVAAWPEEHQEAYAMMLARCGLCHTAEHALAPRLPMATWSKRLRAMAKVGPGLTGVEMSEVARFRIYYVARYPPLPPPPR